MKPTQREKAFVDKISSVLGEDLDAQDPESRARRYRDRLSALDVAAPKAGRRRGARPVTWVAALVVATLMVIMASALILRPPPQAPVTESLAAGMDILSSPDPMEFYENLEFYRWIAGATANATAQ